MSKKYGLSRQQRKSQRAIRNLIIGILAIVLISSFLIILQNKNRGSKNYSPEQLLHDHDGDGIPDH